ncbi:MAG TPA: DUF4176 domain-containing protein [Candidatus Gemmiger faecigallinarum]|nr:DUF4176 domain-containing protein [Candidatus Gemmiger faecigallinarum]
MKDLLPIGSVIRLKGAEKRLMVFGVRQTDRSDKKEYDYIGVLYPEGNIGEQGQFLFNHENIEEVNFRGFEDQERAAFLNKLDSFYSKKPSDK